MNMRQTSHTLCWLFLLACLGASPENPGLELLPIPAAESSGSWNGMRGHSQECSLCHVPPPASTDFNAESGEVLWNESENNTSFQMYTTLAGNTGVLNGQSKLCLSCHDGVTAMDSYGGAAGGPMRGKSLGQDLTNDHPVGIDYPPRGRSGARLRGYHYPPRGNVKLHVVEGQERVECSTCHDPHGSPLNHLLRDEMERNRLCLNCHEM